MAEFEVVSAVIGRYQIENGSLASGRSRHVACGSHPDRLGRRPTGGVATSYPGAQRHRLSTSQGSKRISPESRRSRRSQNAPQIAPKCWRSLLITRAALRAATFQATQEAAPWHDGLSRADRFLLDGLRRREGKLFRSGDLHRFPGCRVAAKTLDAALRVASNTETRKRKSEIGLS